MAEAKIKRLVGSCQGKEAHFEGRWLKSHQSPLLTWGLAETWEPRGQTLLLVPNIVLEP